MIGQDFVQRVNTRGETFLGAKRSHIAEISADATPLVDALSALMRGGKKLRPILAWIGWRAAGGAHDAESPEHLGAALELFQAAALIHDDVIDRSDTRRGYPSTHKWFEQWHATKSYSGGREHFGTTGAVLSGDIALAWASEAFDAAWDAAPTPGPQGRPAFRTMHTDVIAGQYLDVVAEVDAAEVSEELALARARAVLTYKSAKYSTEYPVLIGASLAGASNELLAALSASTVPLGQAFQLRDDLLGIFGDTELTGKPVGDDLREGKRTELIAYGLFRSDPQSAARLNALLGHADLSTADVEEGREILRRCGAVTAVEEQIDSLVCRSNDAVLSLRALGVDGAVLADFAEIRDRLVTRTS